MKAINDKTFTEKVLKHFSVCGNFTATNPDGLYAITGDGYCALLLSRDHYDLPYTNELHDEWTTNLSLPRIVLGYITIDRLRSFLLEIASETLPSVVPPCLYAERMKEQTDVVVTIGHHCAPYWKIDRAWRMLFAIGAEVVRLSTVEGVGGCLLIEPTVGGEPMATVVVPVQRSINDNWRRNALPMLADTLDNDPDCFAILAPTNLALLENERIMAYEARKAFRKVYAVTLAKYAVVNVYANSEQEAEKIARDNVDDWDFDDIELDGIEEDPSIDENTDVYGAEGLLDLEVYMKEEE